MRASSRTGPYPTQTPKTFRASCHAASIGAAWTFDHDPPLMVDSGGVSLPEVTIAVRPEVRGNGLGGALLDDLVARCEGKYAALSLNVHKRNPATHLYQRKGFRSMGQGRGALGIAMRKDLR